MGQQGFDASTIKRSTWLTGVGASCFSSRPSWPGASLALGRSRSTRAAGTPAPSAARLLRCVDRRHPVVVDYMEVDVSQIPIPLAALSHRAGRGVLLVILRFLFMPYGVEPGVGPLPRADLVDVLTYGGWEAAGRRAPSRNCRGGRALARSPPATYARAASTRACSGRRVALVRAHVELVCHCRPTARRRWSTRRPRSCRPARRPPCAARRRADPRPGGGRS